MAVPPAVTGEEMADSDRAWLAEAEQMAYLLRAKGWLALRQGRTGEAVETACDTVDFGLVLLERPKYPINYLLGLAAFEVGLWQLQDVAAYGDLTRPEINALVARLDVEAALHTAAVRAIQGDFAYTVTLLEEGRKLARDRAAEASPIGFLARVLRDPVPLRKINMSRNAYGRRMDEVLDVIDSYRPYPAEPEYGGLLGSFRSMARRYGWGQVIRNPLGCILLDMVSGAPERMSIEHHGVVARLRMTRMMLALRAYRIEKGALPDSLDVLAPACFDAVPVDPFTEEQFVYDVGADTPIIASVGPDQQRDPPEDRDPDDIVIELIFARTATDRNGDRLPD
jgi:hypothetical protein